MTITNDAYLRQQDYLKAWFNLSKLIVSNLEQFPFIPLGFNISFSIKDCPDAGNKFSCNGCMPKDHGVIVYANCGETIGDNLLHCFVVWLLEKIDNQYQIDLFRAFTDKVHSESTKEYLNYMFTRIQEEIDRVY